MSALTTDCHTSTAPPFHTTDGSSTTEVDSGRCVSLTSSQNTLRDTIHVGCGVTGGWDGEEGPTVPDSPLPHYLLQVQRGVLGTSTGSARDVKVVVVMVIQDTEGGGICGNFH